MKKKGFTLIEVLSVIIVLSILVLITVPIISGVVSKIKKGSFESSIHGLIDSTKLFYTDNLKVMTDNKEYIFDCDKYECKTENGDELSYKGERPIGGKIILNGNGTIQITDLTNGEYYANLNAADGNITITKKSSVLTRDELTEIVKQLQEEFENIKTDKEILDQLYPVGSIYMSMDITTSEDVGKKLGGTWEVYAGGRTLVGVGSNGETDYTKVGLTGGQSNIILDTDNLPSHNHSYTPSSTVSSTFTGKSVNTSTTDINHGHDFSATTSISGFHQHALSSPLMSWPLASSSAGRETFSGWQTTANWPSIPPICSTNEAGAHYHTVSGTTGWMRENNTHNHTLTASGTVSSTFTGTKANTSSIGSGNSFNVQDQYITVYMYKRVK